MPLYESLIFFVLLLISRSLIFRFQLFRLFVLKCLVALGLTLFPLSILLSVVCDLGLLFKVHLLTLC